MANRKESNEQDNTRFNRAGQGTGAGRAIGEELESGAGHPVGGRNAQSSDRAMPEHMPPSTDTEHWQKDRKGQAQSPRELNLDQPEKKKEGHR